MSGGGGGGGFGDFEPPSGPQVNLARGKHAWQVSEPYTNHLLHLFANLCQN